MISPEFAEHLTSQGAVLAKHGNLTTVCSFGDAAAETRAAATTGAVFPVPEFLRIGLSGADRVKFLHNFCTNDVKGLAVGHVVEAFLTDARARILGHGYIAAFADRLEIWMLPGNASTLLQHLQKYVIVEDVVVTMIESSAVLAIAGPNAPQLVAKLLGGSAVPAQTSTEADCGCVVAVNWNKEPMIFVAISDKDQVVPTWQSLIKNDAKPAGQTAFDAVRIADCFPRIGTDLTDANMAPEAGRTSRAICYTKGCYLGQEPIARLDAMGHVNRQLYAGVVEWLDSADTNPDEKRPVVTSLAEISESDIRGLAVLPVKLVPPSVSPADSPGVCIDCLTPADRAVRFTVTQAASSD